MVYYSTPRPQGLKVYTLPAQPASHVVDKEYIYRIIHWEQRAAREVIIWREVTADNADKQSQRCVASRGVGRASARRGLRQPAREW